MPYETLIVEKQGGVCTLTLNRPNSLNAINGRMAVEFQEVIKDLQRDEAISAVVLTGAGRAFCAGADIKELADPNVKGLEVGQGRPQTLFFDLEDLDKIVIAAINGPCNGGGLEMALSCDFRIATPGASFGLGEVKLGVIPEGGGTARLPRIIGIQRAKKLLYFGDRIDGNEALGIGLVDELAPADSLLEAANAWASDLAERSPLALRAIKSCCTQGMQMDLKSAIHFEAKCAAWLFKTEDRMEGLTAFIEKRKPEWKSR